MPPNNLELMHYYIGRKVWLAEPDAIPARIAPYVVQGSNRTPRMN